MCKSRAFCFLFTADLFAVQPKARALCELCVLCVVYTVHCSCVTVSIVIAFRYDEIETNSNNIIIGNLLFVADLTSKTVILSTIVTKFLLPKFELSTLEQCVYFINIAVIVKDSEDNALFSNKATLADRIILEI